MESNRYEHAEVESVFCLQVIRELVTNKIFIDSFSDYNITIDDIHLYDADLMGLIQALSFDNPKCVIDVSKIGVFEVAECKFTVELNHRGNVVFLDTHKYDRNIKRGQLWFADIVEKYHKIDETRLNQIVKETSRQLFVIPSVKLKLDSPVRQANNDSSEEKLSRPFQGKFSSPELRKVTLGKTLFSRPRATNSDVDLLRSTTSIAPKSTYNIGEIVKGGGRFKGGSKLFAQLLVLHSIYDVNVLYYLLSPVGQDVKKVRSSVFFDEIDRDALVSVMNAYGLIGKILKNKKEMFAVLKELYPKNEQKKMSAKLRKFERKHRQEKARTKKEELEIRNTLLAEYIIARAGDDDTFIYYAFVSFGKRMVPRVFDIFKKVLTLLRTGQEVDREHGFISLLLLKNVEIYFHLLSCQEFVDFLEKRKIDPVIALLYSELLEKIEAGFEPENLAQTTEEKRAYRRGESLLAENLSRTREITNCVCLSAEEARNILLLKQNTVRTKAKVDWQKLHDENIGMLVSAFAPFLPRYLKQLPRLFRDFKETAVGNLVNWKRDGCNPSLYKLERFPRELVMLQLDSNEVRNVRDVFHKPHYYLLKEDLEKYRTNLEKMKELHETISSFSTQRFEDGQVCDYFSTSWIAKELLLKKKIQFDFSLSLSREIVNCFIGLTRDTRVPKSLYYKNTTFHIQKRGQTLFIYAHDLPELFGGLQKLGQEVLDESSRIVVIRSWCQNKILETKRKEQIENTTSELREVLLELLDDLFLEIDANDETVVTPKMMSEKIAYLIMSFYLKNSEEALGEEIKFEVKKRLITRGKDLISYHLSGIDITDCIFSVIENAKEKRDHGLLLDKSVYFDFVIEVDEILKQCYAKRQSKNLYL